MQKKIVAVVAGAVLVACLLGFVLLKFTSRPTPSQPAAPVAGKAAGPVLLSEKSPPAAPKGTAPAVPAAPGKAGAPPAEKAVPVPSGKGQPVPRENLIDTRTPAEIAKAAAPKDRQGIIAASLKNGGRELDGLPVQAKLSVVQQAAQLSDEQAVMLQSYLEAFEKFDREGVRATTGMSSKSGSKPHRNPPPSAMQQGGPSRQPSRAMESLDQRIAVLEIMTAELKEVRDLRDQFTKSLKPEQEALLGPLFRTGRL